ncbi:intermembrane phospholipid transport protein YdbH family protein [Paraglaciecola arctica]|uniref:intermembrane phospholipid transport protein YdbH family protein n=1 Tax=Paraglaciecola arctica TaxID=1128911 RepID=UPI001C071421|nr:YdbH domain-containing protein [Paraglaciecola arctica]MBU3003106.1 YdbH domain-containing protein [Paraglaciecola arctica]
MTTLFWQKRPSKKLLAVILLVVALITLIVFRRPIAIKTIEHFTRAQNLEVSCLDFSFDWQLNLKIEQVCMSSPLGNVLVRDAIWQPWPNILNIEKIKVTHLGSSNQFATESKPKPSTDPITLPKGLPKLRISKVEIDSAALRQPLNLSMNSVSSNELRITGDINAAIKMSKNTLTATLEWSLFDLTNWLPQVQNIAANNPQLLGKFAADNTKIATRLIFDGKTLNSDSSLLLSNRVELENCPIEVALEGHVLVDLELSGSNLRVDLSQLKNNFSLMHCPVLQDYFADHDLPALSFLVPQKVTINATQINLPQFLIIDKHNPTRSLELQKLTYQFTGGLRFGYEVSIAQSIQSKLIQAGMFELQTQGDISVDASQLHTPLSAILKFSNNTHKLEVSDLKLDSLHLASLGSQFSVEYQIANPIKIQAVVDTSGIQLDDLKLLKTTSQLTASGETLNNLQLNIDTELLQLSHPETKVQKIHNQLTLNLKELSDLSFTGNSNFTGITAQNIKLQPITMAHSGQVSWPETIVSSDHEINLEQGFSIRLQQQQSDINLQVVQQDVIGLQSIVSQLDNALTIKQGDLSANIDFTLPEKGEELSAQGEVDVQNITASYQDYELSNISYQTPLTFDSAGLQISESSLHIDSVDAGVPIEDLNAQLIANNSVFRLQQVRGQIFNGRFSTSQLWLDGRDQQFNVKFQNIDLAEVIALQQQPGIKITGTMDGDLPMVINKKGISIDEGWASSLSGGKLTIVDNPSFESIKQQQPQLALLENLDFTQLESNVKLTPDGWMFFDFALQGNNPDKKQSVNFNYTHQENIFSLLESIRLVNSVGNNIEQKITQGDKK